MEDVIRSRPVYRASYGSRQAALAELARAQHGVVAHWQLMELGFGRRAIQHRVAVGRLHRMYRGVYAVGHASVGPRGRVMAAVLFGGRGAVASHRTAGDLWGIRRTSTPVVDITVDGVDRGSHRKVRFHRVRRLDPRDVTELDGIPVTSLPRTLLDLAEVLRPHQLRRAFEEAERLRVLDVRPVEELCDRSHGRHGLRPLRALIAEAAPAHDVRSPLEQRFAALLREHGMPMPRFNTLVEGCLVDAYWPEAKLVVELDSREFHLTRAAFEADRARDAKLQLHGIVPLRFTHRMLERDPVAALATTRALYERRLSRSTSG